MPVFHRPLKITPSPDSTSQDSSEARSQMVRDLHARVIAGNIELPEAMKLMRRISGFNQIDFAKHRGISVNALRQLESGQGNPTIETLNKVVSVFGLKVGLVAKR